MRRAFSDAIVHAAQSDPNVLLLTGDHGYALFDDFRRLCPTKYINAGIAEQNMVGMAAGLARTGFRPFVYGLSAFVPIRVLEQIKLDVAHDNLPVIFIGDGAGFVYSHLGTSHQSTEDIACTRAIPNLSVFSPADRFEVTECINLAYQSRSPVYIRLGKSDRGDVHGSLPKLQLSRLINVKPGGRGKITFIATGSMVRTALKIAMESYCDAAVWSAPFVKPIDEDQVAAICRQSNVVAVLEEHSTSGGLGSTIAEISAERAPTPILRIGVHGRFSHYCGTYEYLLQEHELTATQIAMKVDGFLKAHTRCE